MVCNGLSSDAGFLILEVDQDCVCYELQVAGCFRILDFHKYDPSIY